MIDILICNDDDITSRGIKALAEVASDFGNVTVVAPNSPQSGMGHAISIGEPLRLYEYNFKINGKSIPAFACSGTPVDCVKLATAEILHHKPHLVLSGINHGANYSISVFYSGTMSAAVEGAIEGIPAIGFSLCDYDPKADMSASQKIVYEILNKYVPKLNEFPKNVALNINIPPRKYEEIKGIKITRQAMGRFVEEFDRRIDPYGQPYYWLVGKFKLQDNREDVDYVAVQEGFVSVTPIRLELTAEEVLNKVSEDLREIIREQG